MALPKHVRRHSSGRLRAVVSIRGKRVIGPLRDTAEEAEADVVALLARRAELTTRIRKPTLTDALNLLVVELRQLDRAPATIDHYRKAFGYSITGPDGWGPDCPVAEITPADVGHWITKRLRRAKAASVGEEVRSLNRVLGVAVRSGWITQLPTIGVPRPRGKRTRYSFVPASRFVDILRRIRGHPRRAHDIASRDHYADLVELMFLTGIRRSEAAGILVGDVEFASRMLFVRHGKTEPRRMPLNRRAMDVMRAAVGRARGETVFANAVAISASFARWREWLGETQWHPHMLRHSFATYAVERGVDPFTLAQLMGHSDIRQTHRYYHGQDQRARDAMDRIILDPDDD